MTRNQVAWQEALERARSNRAAEVEINRSNLAREAEEHRWHTSVEAETQRHNREAERLGWEQHWEQQHFNKFTLMQRNAELRENARRNTLYSINERLKTMEIARSNRASEKLKRDEINKRHFQELEKISQLRNANWLKHKEAMEAADIKRDELNERVRSNLAGERLAEARQKMERGIESGRRSSESKEGWKRFGSSILSSALKVGGQVALFALTKGKYKPGSAGISQPFIIGRSVIK